MRTTHSFLWARDLAGLSVREKEMSVGNVDRKLLFKRYFLPEVSQYDGVISGNGAVSYIGQAPLTVSCISGAPGVDCTCRESYHHSVVAVWLMFGEGEVDETVLETEYYPGVTFAREYSARDRQLIAEHVFTAGAVDPVCPNSELQTRILLENLSSFLVERGMSLNDNCVRTWFQCTDIDNLYAGLVKGRREFFDETGLTKDTHYLASTGIAGDSPVPGALVQLDSWSIKGDFSQRYLYAPSHLNPTHEYGVTFERGVRVDSAGRAHVIISGTASIDNKGRVVHIGNVRAQTERMLENVTVLLKEAGADWQDMNQAVVYLRNALDCQEVEEILAGRLEGIPYVITVAPVCRPEWLVEMECMAEFRTGPSRERP